MIKEVLRTLREMWRQPGLRPILLGLTAIFAAGTTFYRMFEGWPWLDSLYFTVVTLTTVGYGDFAPTTPLTKGFTILLIFTGVGYILGFLNFLVQRTVERRQERPDKDRIRGRRAD